MYQDPTLWAWFEILPRPPPPPRGNKSKTTPYLRSYVFRFNTLKGTVNAPAVDLGGYTPLEVLNSLFTSILKSLG